MNLKMLTLNLFDLIALKTRVVDIGNYTDIFLNNLTVEVEFEFYPCTNFTPLFEGHVSTIHVGRQHSNSSKL